MTLSEARNRVREAEKKTAHSQLVIEARSLDWDTFSAKRNLELGDPCWQHKALPEIVGHWRGAIYNGLNWPAALLTVEELANIGGYNFQDLHAKYPCAIV